MVKSERTENLLDVLMQYKALEFCGSDLIGRGFFQIKAWDVCKQTKYQPAADVLDTIKEKLKSAIYHEYLKYF
jgi:hypothetical protein